MKYFGKCLLLIFLYVQVKLINSVEWDCGTNSNAGAFTRSSDCTVSGGGHVLLAGVLEITGGSTNMKNLVTITAATGKGHFKLDGASHKLTLRYLKLEGATNVSYGGSLHSSGGTVNLYFSILYNNKAYHGGGIFADNSILNIFNSSIIHNVATNSCGGIYIYKSTINIFGSNISSNDAGGSTGGFGILNSNGLLQDTTISDNKAAEQGGGLKIYGRTDSHGPSNVNITRCTVKSNLVTTSNSSVISGGGLHLKGSTNIIIRETSFLSNMANNNKGHGIVTERNHSYGTPTVSLINTYVNFAKNNIIHEEGGAATWKTCSNTNSACVVEPYTGLCTPVDQSNSKFGVICNYNENYKCPKKQFKQVISSALKPLYKNVSPILYNFAASDNMYLDIPSVAALNFGTGPIKISFWVKAASTTISADSAFDYTALFIKSDEAPYPYTGISCFLYDDGEINWRVDAANNLRSSTDSNRWKVWTHLKLVREVPSNAAPILKIYINDALDSSTTIDLVDVSNSAPLRFGGNHVYSNTQNGNFILYDFYIKNVNNTIRSSYLLPPPQDSICGNNPPLDLEWDGMVVTGKYRLSKNITLRDAVAPIDALDISGVKKDEDNCIIITAATGKRHFNINGAKLTLRYLKLKGGDVSAYGDTDNGKGGSIFIGTNGGTLMLYSVTLYQNQAYLGGAVLGFNAIIHVYNSFIIDNLATYQGGGFYVYNEAKAVLGGAILVYSGAKVYVVSSTFDSNFITTNYGYSTKSGGAVYNEATLALVNQASDALKTATDTITGYAPIQCSDVANLCPMLGFGVFSQCINKATVKQGVECSPSCPIPTSGNVTITEDCYLHNELVLSGATLYITGIPKPDGTLPKIIGGGSNRMFRV
eukprot:g8784.t1